MVSNRSIQLLRIFGERLQKKTDVLILLLFFSIAYYISVDLPYLSRFYPVVFLIVGIIALSVEVIIELLPKRYRTKAKSYNEGVVGHLEKEIEIEADEQADLQEEIPGVTTRRRIRILIMALLVLFFGIFTAFIGLLFTIPMFVFAVVYLVGSQNFVRAFLQSVAFITIIYLTFGVILNTPLFETL